MKRPDLTETQRRAISYATENKYCILALDPGLGKSRCLIELRERLQNNCLVICPSHLILNWVKEIKLWASKDVQITTFRAGKDIYDVCDADFVITSYDLIQQAPHLFEWADIVGIDEAHAIKSMEAKRSTFVHKNVYESSVDRVVELTGTPIKNRVKEFYSLLALTHYNPAIAGSEFLDLYPSEIDFADRYSDRDEYTMEINNRWVTIVKWTGLKNTEELKEHLKNRYFRVRSEDVLDLPPVSYKQLLISDTPDEKLIEAFYSYFADEDNFDPEEDYTTRRARNTSSVMPEHKAVAALKKVPFTIKYAKDLLEETGCVLIYSDHVQAAEEIARAFKVKALTGKVPSHVRSQMADAFQAGEGEVLVATIGSMKEGKDLFRSNQLIFNDFSWVPGDMKQVIHRIQRMGQKSHCTVHRILGSPQDEKILEAIEEKLAVIEKAT